MDFSKTRQQAEKKHMQCIFISLRKTTSLQAYQRLIFTFFNVQQKLQEICASHFLLEHSLFCPLHTSAASQGGAKGAFPWPQGAATELFQGMTFQPNKKQRDVEKTDLPCRHKKCSAEWDATTKMTSAKLLSFCDTAIVLPKGNPVNQ